MPGQGGFLVDLKKFVTSWNGLLFILVIGIFLMVPAFRGGQGSDDMATQVQLFVGVMAVLWALKGAWDKLRGKGREDE
jgi:hypothetical protein